MLNVDLSGKVAVITGSSRGIGKGIALMHAQAGAKVVVSSRTHSACQEVVDEIKGAGGDAIAVACDIISKQDCTNLIDSARKAFGKIDILVCNAALNPWYDSLIKVPDDIYDECLNANVRSPLWLIQMVFPEMKERRDGSIILISSGAGFFGLATLGLYAITKAAEMQLARNIAVEGGPHNVRTNVIAPGLIDTDFAAPVKALPDMYNDILAGIPLGRIGTVEEIAGAALFLASDLGSFMNGHTMCCDGGTAIFKAG